MSYPGSATIKSAMSGHSKWSTIKRAKGVADAKRSQLFTKLAKAITVAARDGADPSMNPKLRLAVDRARSFSMPKDNVERAIQKGIGGGEGTKLEEVRYEGYGPGGVAFLIDAVTDNRNRTASEIRHLLERAGGRLGEMGSVAWMFELKGLIQVTPNGKWDELELALIEAGALDIREDANELIITCDPPALEQLKAELTARGLAPTYASIEPLAKTSIPVEESSAERLDQLRETLDEHDDITNFYDNGT